MIEEVDEDMRSVIQCLYLVMIYGSRVIDVRLCRQEVDHRGELIGAPLREWLTTNDGRQKEGVNDMC